MSTSFTRCAIVFTVVRPAFTAWIFPRESTLAISIQPGKIVFVNATESFPLAASQSIGCCVLFAPIKKGPIDWLVEKSYAAATALGSAP